MKSTGIVRRIDDAGRVVIPRETRQKLRIRGGDPLELYTGDNEELILKKYSPVGEIRHLAATCVTAAASATALPVLVCDTNQVIAVAGTSRDEMMGRAISADLIEMGDNRRKYRAWPGEEQLLPIMDCLVPARAAAPIIAMGDVTGYVVLLQGGPHRKSTPVNAAIVDLLADILARETEG